MNERNDFVPAKLETYMRYRDKIRDGDLIEWDSSTVFGWLIRRFCSHSHTSFVIIKDDRVMILEALDDGWVPNYLSKRLLEHRGRAYWLHLKMMHSPAIDELVRFRLKHHAEDMAEKNIRYDWGSLVKNLFGKVSANAKRLFCSEAAFLLYKQENIVDGEKTPRPGQWAQYHVHEPEVRIL